MNGRSSATRRVSVTIAKIATSASSTANFFCATSHSPRLVIRSTLTAMLATATATKAIIPTAQPRVRRRRTPSRRPNSRTSAQAATIRATAKRSRSELKGRLTFGWTASKGTRKIIARKAAISQGSGRRVRGQASAGISVRAPQGAPASLAPAAGARLGGGGGGRRGREAPAALSARPPPAPPASLAPAAGDRLGRDQQHAPPDQHGDEDEGGDLDVGAGVDDAAGRLSEPPHLDLAVFGGPLLGLEALYVGGERRRRRIRHPHRLLLVRRLGEDRDDRQVGVVLEAQAVEGALADDLRAALLGGRALVEAGHVEVVGALGLDRVERKLRFLGDQRDRSRGRQEAGEDVGPGLERIELAGQIGEGRARRVDEDLGRGGGEDVGAALQRGRREADPVDAEQGGDQGEPRPPHHEAAAGPEDPQGARELHASSSGSLTVAGSGTSSGPCCASASRQAEIRRGRPRIATMKMVSRTRKRTRATFLPIVSSTRVARAGPSSRNSTRRSSGVPCASWMSRTTRR